MIKDTISDDMINLVLRQLGATSIKNKPGHINTVKFDIGPELRITYLYEVKDGEGAYLQRVDPYPMMIGKLYNEEDIISIIKRDLNKFKHAYESSNFNKFLDVATGIMAFDKEFENLFLLRNVSSENLERLANEISRVHKVIDEIEEESELLDHIVG